MEERTPRTCAATAGAGGPERRAGAAAARWRLGDVGAICASAGCGAPRPPRWAACGGSSPAEGVRARMEERTPRTCAATATGGTLRGLRAAVPPRPPRWTACGAPSPVRMLAPGRQLSAGEELPAGGSKTRPGGTAALMRRSAGGGRARRRAAPRTSPRGARRPARRVAPRARRAPGSRSRPWSARPHSGR